MFHKNLRYYRLKKSMNKKELASKVNLSPMAITNYENGKRTPDMDTLKRLAQALEIRVSDFLAPRNTNLVFQHGAFRKNTSMLVMQQDFVRESVEEYLGRFYTVLECLGGDVLPEAPQCHAIAMTGDVEADAKAMRAHLGLAPDGPVCDLISVLENKGILIYLCDIDNSSFSGMNGFVNDRPYIILNKNMTPERNRSTLAHELAHLLFCWPDDMEESTVEKTATAIGGAFLFLKNDVVRELGLRRYSISKDMLLVCREYGISMLLLVKRAQIAHIISAELAKDFFIKASQWGWRTNEPSRMERERPMLFQQLVLRAVNEKEISIQKGAELLQMPYDEVLPHCCFVEQED